MTIETAPGINEAFRALYLLPTAPRELIDAVYDALCATTAAPDRLRAARETIAHESITTPQSPEAKLSWRVNPWELLHLRPDAPPFVIETAYRFRRGERPTIDRDDPAPPTLTSPPPLDDPVAATFRSPPPSQSEVPELEDGVSPLPHAGEGPGVREDEELPSQSSPPPLEEGLERGTLLSAFEELANQISPPPHAGACPEPSRREASGVRAEAEVTLEDDITDDDDVLGLIEDFALLSVYEELIEEADEADDIAAEPGSLLLRVRACPEPSRREGPEVKAEADASAFLSADEELLTSAMEPDPPPHTKERQGVSEIPTLTAVDGTTLSLTDRPLRIGTQPACDAIVRASGRVEARIWRNKGRVLVHALGEADGVLLNGAPVSWAVLDDGDALTVGPATYRFRA